MYYIEQACSLLYLFSQRRRSLLNPVSVFLQYQMFKVFDMKIVFKGLFGTELLSSNSRSAFQDIP